MSAPRELPMAAVGCTLAEHDLAGQLERYRRLGAAATRLERRRLGLTAWFESGVDAALLDETIAVERGCCTFFKLDYDTSERSLSITVDGPERLETLNLLGSALAGSGWAGDGR